ncbi:MULTISPECIES: hypothetical protein [Enterobacter]|uniref:hypothetical protein n=1 Tax=Enterobacter TaxID=547 RepID=UPI000DCBD24B|nr:MULTISPECIES: hypothetical protein [Enterobacter]RAY73715.1 hypothetical protein DP185_01295 [Enterobacter hormaechei]MBJ6405609.1 hypothetical protein [Enterobacter cloacae]MBJ6485905.1 hypothetical protein [Enterobacter cloacae]MBJ6496418.1 hypothetical protein [Enterobacter cloacae]MBK4529494.1 hypothetical protein [Enterobacter cloacae]
MTQIKEITNCRVQVSQLYHVHERDGAEVIFRSDGTRFGKSYGVIQGYIEYLERYTLGIEIPIATSLKVLLYVH